MEQRHITAELHTIPKGDLSQGIAGLIAQTIMDYGKSIDADIQKHIIKRVYGMLNSAKYRHWQWREVITAFERGKIGQYGGESRCSVAGIERWLHGYGNERLRTIVDSNIKQQQEQRNNTISFIENKKFAAAFHAACTKRLKAASFNRPDKAKLPAHYMPSMIEVMNDMAEDAVILENERV